MRPARGKPLPPLPKNDIKIILKPHKGLMLKEYLKTEIPQAIIRSTGSIIPGSGPNQRKITGEDFILRIREGTNIIIVSTPSLEVADVIRRITCMELRGKQHPFNVYVADPDDSYKGVVHGFPAHTESADLQQHLRVRTQGVTIERARMLGSSNTALLTFSGGTRPKCVYYMGVEMRCTEYRPTVQMCLECMQEGHRSDVCPNPKNICRGCGLENPPPQGHECEVKCAVCRAAGHETHRCPNKLIAAKRGKTTHQSRSRERSEQRTKKAPGRWFESTEEEDLYRRRSRSRSSQRGTAKSSTPSRDPSGSRASQRSNSPLPKKQQVSWARIVSPTAPKQNTGENDKRIQKLEKENARLREQLLVEERKRKSLEKQMSELEARLNNKIEQLETPRQTKEIAETNAATDITSGSAPKAAALRQFIKNFEIAPDVICLQEVRAKPAKMQGYYTLSDPQNSKVATLAVAAVRDPPDHVHYLINLFLQ
ncbi:hypothetical protein HPB49_011091 [Dermacentor silvarum]|uniref:Uncharacterized protein n=1 Tax=Dermacentor silvarum TaxID=543639 RepID=A0ACB8DZI7_DERSI|nr:hypothetical protein HPB49_011091 [Dermacentor silvarum]